MDKQGNTSSMREALEAFVQLVDDGMIKPRAMGHHDEHCFVVVQGMARAALAAPTRNCDVGSPEEQLGRHEKWCDAIRNGQYGYHCSDAPSCSACFAKWAQMPYEESK